MIKFIREIEHLTIKVIPIEENQLVDALSKLAFGNEKTNGAHFVEQYAIGILT